MKRKQKVATKLISQTTTKRGKRTMKIGTWNVRGLNEKEPELVQQLQKNKLHLLGVTETKKKGRGLQKLYLHSGVTPTERARGGVSLIHREEDENLSPKGRPRKN